VKMEAETAVMQPQATEPPGTKRGKEGLSVVAHACNPSYSGGRDGRVMDQGQPRQKVVKTRLNQ